MTTVAGFLIVIVDTVYPPLALGPRFPVSTENFVGGIGRLITDQAANSATFSINFLAEQSRRLMYDVDIYNYTERAPSCKLPHVM
jgi:hypothetical protein